MNILTRFWRYGSAHLTLDRLIRDCEKAKTDPAQLVRLTFSFCGGFLEPIQMHEEIIRLVQDVMDLKPSSILEIGTAQGGTLFLWARVADPAAVLVSVDLPGGKFCGGYSPLRTPVYRKFRGPGQKIHLLRADSHAPETCSQVRVLLDKPADFLFIDGDHTYDGVKRDWEMYSELVRPGGLVAFHDVGKSYEDTEVQRFWDEIKGGFEHSEYIFHPKRAFGIGVLRK